MKNRFFLSLSLQAIFLINIACSSTTIGIDVDKELNYCAGQATSTLEQISLSTLLPNHIEKDSTKWHFKSLDSWTSGFWPGILWYLYENSQDTFWKNEANKVTETILPKTFRKANNHDLGFIAVCSLGNGYRLTGNEKYKEGLLRAADSLAVLFNPIVGTILSWPEMIVRKKWPHNTIIDNMMNLELLFWASKNGGSRRLYDIALKHAKTTMQYGFRENHTNYHVAVYDTITGKFIMGVTHQGYSDDSMWARGQAWAIYGYTMVYRETKDVQFLDFVQKVTHAYLSRLPEDLIPYWDFKACEHNPNALRDASAAAISASALLELSTYISDKKKSREYRNIAEQILLELSTEKYQSRNNNSAFLMHSVGHMPYKKEVDTSIIYADYYYIEALLRLKRLKSGMNILATLTSD